MKSNVKSIKFRLSLLSISLFCASGFSISAAIPNMKMGLKSVSQTNIEVLVSIPTFGLLIAVLFSSYFSRKIGAKKTVIVGLVTMTIAGIIPFFTDEYLTILISRFIFGLGIGVFNSLCFSLISDFYSGSERAKMIGLQSAAQALGSTILSLIVSILIPLGWHVVFLIYLFNFVPLILFSMNIPEPQKSIKKEKINRNIFSKKLIFTSVWALVYFATELSVTYKCSSLIVNEGIGTSSQASLILALNTAIGFFSGLLFSQAFKIFKNYLAPISLFCLALIFFGLNFSKTITLIALLIILSGLFASLMSSYLYNSIANLGNHQTQAAINTVLIVGVNIGCFVNPYLNKGMSILIHTEEPGKLIFCSGMILLICSIIVFIIFKTSKD